jgi:hypothetical protein
MKPSEKIGREGKLRKGFKTLDGGVFKAGEVVRVERAGSRGLTVSKPAPVFFAKGTVRDGRLWASRVPSHYVDVAGE